MCREMSSRSRSMVVENVCAASRCRKWEVLADASDVRVVKGKGGKE